MNGVDLFAGAGGMSLGATKAGINVVLAVEADAHAAATYKANHPDTHVFENDIRTLSRARLTRLLRRRSIDVVFGGPPCQGFSYSNLRTRNPRNRDNWLILEFLRIVELLKPPWVVFENVRGIINTAQGVFLDNVRERLQTLGYSLKEWLLNAADYGVPQDRARYFLIGTRTKARLRKPRMSRAKPVTVAQALRDLPPLTNGAGTSWLKYTSQPPSSYARQLRNGQSGCANHVVSRNAPAVIRRYAFIPQGGNWENIPARLMRNYADRTRCHTGIYHRLKSRAPSIVIGNYRKNMLIHPTQDRGLSVREAARIQSFPDHYDFQGSIGFQQQQVGNAVPPMLAHAVFRAVVTAHTEIG